MSTKNRYQYNNSIDEECSLAPKTSRLRIRRSIEQRQPIAFYPEVNIKPNIVTDANGKSFRVTKIYNPDGVYHYRADEVKFCMIKVPGTSYYRPLYE